MDNQDSELSKSIRANMQLKDTRELLAIWTENDRSEWSELAVAVVHDILLKRLGSVPPQDPDGTGRRRNMKTKHRTKVPPLLIVLFAPAVVLFPLIVLASLIKPGPDDKWFTNLLFSALILFFLVPGCILGWKSWFQGEEITGNISRNLPELKRRWGSSYHLHTLFLPDRYVPLYWLWSVRLVSLVLLGGAAKTPARWMSTRRASPSPAMVRAATWRRR